MDQQATITPRIYPPMIQLSIPASLSRIKFLPRGPHFLISKSFHKTEAIRRSWQIQENKRRDTYMDPRPEGGTRVNPPVPPLEYSYYCLPAPIVPDLDIRVA